MTSTMKTCVICNKEMRTYLCDGCSQRFCLKHLDEHRKHLEKEFDQIETEHDEFRQMINEHKQDSTMHPIIDQINQWERNSINRVKQTAQECREMFLNHAGSLLLDVEKKFDQLTEQMKVMRQENEFNDLDLNQIKQKLNQMKRELLHSENLCVRKHSTSFINSISLCAPSEFRWKTIGTTIAGEGGRGDRLDQLHKPYGICFDDQNQAIYIADSSNHRIMEWESSNANGRIVAGGNGKGNRAEQLNGPSHMIIDRQNNCFIIADYGNRRVIRWPRQTQSSGQIIISDIDCARLAMHKDGTLYVSDYKKNEVRRWREGEKQGTVVAGGSGQGNRLEQFNCPVSIFVDDDHTLYISDLNNHRVMKWRRDAKEGLIVAGGNGRGNHVKQLNIPQDVIVDQSGQIYVVDGGNDRVMRWREEASEGIIVIGGTGRGQQPNQLNSPVGSLFDSDGNLYISDWGNHRIQKFDTD